MIHHLSLGSRGIESSAHFYDAALAPLGYVRVWSDLRPGEQGQAVGYGYPGGGDLLCIKQIDDSLALRAPGFHLALAAASREQVHAFHRAALAAGGHDNGPPGPRPAYGPHYYAAFVIDPDGHHLEAVCKAALPDPAPATTTMQPSRPPQCRKAQPTDFAALAQLLELYQYELADIWPQRLDAAGRYGYDLQRHANDERHHAYLALADGQPVGFALVAPARVTRSDGCWMEQFFILKTHRRSGLGRALALHALTAHPGPWEVGQMTANRGAQAFWRAIAREVGRGSVQERQVTRGPWQGVVQQFDVAQPPTETPP
jgi:predicted acetyltransferase/catechol 2,3-dioxygenase-like lactoylglutathione lyase family enzyme